MNAHDMILAAVSAAAGAYLVLLIHMLLTVRDERRSQA